LGRDLRISDLKKSGFGIPYTKIDCLSEIMNFPDDNVRVVDYLNYAREVLETNLKKIS
jgi:hypothetical protein